MNVDDATDLPINDCVKCGCEVIGYLDDPYTEYYCDKCREDEEE